MRNCWLLMAVGVSIFSVAVWQWGWIHAQLPPPLPDCPIPLPERHLLPPVCIDADGMRHYSFRSFGEYEMAPFVFYLAAGFILPIGMTIIGILGLFGRGPAAQSPQNSTE